LIFFSQTKNKIVGFESLGYTLNIVHTVLSDDSINLIDKQSKIENLSYPFLVKFNTTKNSYPKGIIKIVDKLDKTLLPSSHGSDINHLSPTIILNLKEQTKLKFEWQEIAGQLITYLEYAERNDQSFSFFIVSWTIDYFRKYANEGMNADLKDSLAEGLLDVYSFHRVWLVFLRF